MDRSKDSNGSNTFSAGLIRNFQRRWTLCHAEGVRASARQSGICDIAILIRHPRYYSISLSASRRMNIPSLWTPLRLRTLKLLPATARRTTFFARPQAVVDTLDFP